MRWICVRKSADRIYRIPCCDLDSSYGENPSGWEYNPSSIDSNFIMKAGSWAVFHDINLTLYQGEKIFWQVQFNPPTAVNCGIIAFSGDQFWRMQLGIWMSSDFKVWYYEGGTNTQIGTAAQNQWFSWSGYKTLTRNFSGGAGITSLFRLGIGTAGATYGAGAQIDLLYTKCGDLGFMSM